MPVRFSRLRIAGFKSFAEPATIEILPGLTGVVGPNGCGKSNVAEALRWAMGESSARNMRGGEMDDVIFAGTAHRPSRNLAEVSLTLEEAAGIAPPPFHDSPELEITRRIERGGGSAFRVNGREARARDVQTLFADLASGARSSAMVSQGRVGALVGARPEERRAVLEEAAGITGLHARRHEAELKLKAAEANLERSEDLRAQLDSRLDALRKQAKQAARYRTVSVAIRETEAELLALQLARAAARQDAALAALRQARADVASTTAAAAGAAAKAAETVAILPALRSAEAERRTALERRRVAHEQLAAEEARAAEALDAARARLTQLDSDLAHAGSVRRDAAEALGRLDQEHARLAAEDAADPARRDRAAAELTEAAAVLTAADSAALAATDTAADLAARHRAATDSLAQARQRHERLAAQRATLHREQQDVAAQSISPAALAEAEAAKAQTEQTLAEAATRLTDATTRRQHTLQTAAETIAAAQAQAAALRAEAHEAATAHLAAARHAAAASLASARAAAANTRAEAAAALDSARAAAARTGLDRDRLAMEDAGLRNLLASGAGAGQGAIADTLHVPPGLEVAVGAAFGDALDAATDEIADRHWRTLPPTDPSALPGGVTPLAGVLQAPPPLDRALAAIGLVTDGDPLQPHLVPGQVLVSRDGAVWRWDGLVLRAGAPVAAAVRLQQRNRLAEVTAALDAATQAAVAAAQTLAATEQAHREAGAAADTAEREATEAAAAAEHAARAHAAAAEQAARTEADETERQARANSAAAEQAATAAETAARATRAAAETTLERARATAAQLRDQSARAAARAAAIDDRLRHLAEEHADAETALATAQATHAAISDPDAARRAMEQARAALAAARTRHATAEAERDRLARATAGRAHRQRTLIAERQGWSERAADAALRVTDLQARQAEARAAHAAAEAAPLALQARRTAILDDLQSAEQAHLDAADTLIAAEAEAETAARAARAADASAATAREAAARADGEAAQAEEASAAVAARVEERLGPNPALPDPPATIDAETEDKLRRRLDRLLREREDIGPVNLRAEHEAEELAGQIATIERERDELTTAIAKLRGSIGHLNREGRERLAAVFAEVDRHFQSLFARMFGGGRAHLAMVGSDDPLLAGLEIYAQPPGKKLATLSLLSGGEQALTALSLIFAVFRCNPAPLCALDEVDAPLDDANVDRFCALLDEIVQETGTRFLVVTHHHLTMARMDRLYGVTMQERGVSRILSVDLHRATQLAEQPRLAAE